MEQSEAIAKIEAELYKLENGQKLQEYDRELRKYIEERSEKTRQYFWVGIGAISAILTIVAYLGVQSVGRDIGINAAEEAGLSALLEEAKGTVQRLTVLNTEARDLVESIASIEGEARTLFAGLENEVERVTAAAEVSLQASFTTTSETLTQIREQLESSRAQLAEVDARIETALDKISGANEEALSTLLANYAEFEETAERERTLVSRRLEGDVGKLASELKQDLLLEGDVGHRQGSLCAGDWRPCANCSFPKSLQKWIVADTSELIDPRITLRISINDRVRALHWLVKDRTSKGFGVEISSLFDVVDITRQADARICVEWTARGALEN